MYQFDYHAPSSLQEARALFEAADDPQYLAGGMTLLPTMKQRLAAPSSLIDLGGIEALREITVDADGVRVGALVRHDQIARHTEILASLPVVAQLAGLIGDAQVRNRGTLGGSLANNDPAADYPAAALGLGATITTDRRSITAEDFFQGMFSTALEEGEILTEVTFPRPDRASYRKFPNPASRYAMVGVLVAQIGTSIRVAVTGAAAGVFRLTEYEQALGESLTPRALESIEVDSSEYNEDLHADAEYRANLVKVMAQRAVEDIVS